MPKPDYIEQNRKAWNEVLPYHQKSRPVDLEAGFKQKGFSVLDSIETPFLQKLAVGKDVAQLCCNNGRELISLLNIGAKSGMGFDLSDAAIDEARWFNKLSEQKADFIRTNVFDIDQSYHNRFDLVYITIGALAWLDDLEAFFQIVSNLLRIGGHLFIYEQHPIGSVFFKNSDNHWEVGESYFRSEPYVSNEGLDYYGFAKYDASTSYEFFHPLSQIMNAIIKSGIVIEEFYEYPHDITNCLSGLNIDNKLPLSYVLVGEKR